MLLFVSMWQHVYPSCSVSLIFTWLIKTQKCLGYLTALRLLCWCSCYLFVDEFQESRSSDSCYLPQRAGLGWKSVCVSSVVSIQWRVIVGTKQQTILIYNRPYLQGVLDAALLGPINERPTLVSVPLCVYNTHPKQISNKLVLSKYATPVCFPHCSPSSITC